VTAMSKRASVVQPSQEISSDATERPIPRRSQTDLSQAQRHAKTVRTSPGQAPTKSGALALSAANGTKSSGPPSPTRPRASSTMANPRVPQQSLDAAAQMLAPRPSDVGRQAAASSNSPLGPSSVDHQNASSSVSPMTERRPRMTTELPRSAAPANALAAVPPSPRRTTTAPALPPMDKRTRSRRHTNASTKDISSPILDPGQEAFLFLDARVYSSYQGSRCDKEHESC
jgi:hypothetical protein